MASDLTITISRSHWHRGAGRKGMLLNGHGEPCAAGAVCLALGIPAKELQGRYDLPIPATASPIRRLWEDDFETTFGLINDAEWLTDTQREAELIEAAAPYGVAFNFVA